MHFLKYRLFFKTENTTNYFLAPYNFSVKSPFKYYQSIRFNCVQVCIVVTQLHQKITKGHQSDPSQLLCPTPLSTCTLTKCKLALGMEIFGPPLWSRVKYLDILL